MNKSMITIDNIYRPSHRNWKFFSMLLITVIVACAVSGCGNGDLPRDTRLLAIDSIVDTDSVTAWRELQAIDSAALTTEADRALYALLHQQIRYRQYLPPDTLVLARLYDYYSAHPDNKRLTRTLLLTGGAYEDAGQIDKAILWYKRAETMTDTADYLNLAKVNLRLGLLYYNNYADHHIVKQKLEQSAHYYTLLGDSANLAVTLDFLGGVYRTINHQKAHETLKRAAEISLAINDEYTYLSSSEKLARCLLNDSLPQESLDIITMCQSHNMEHLTSDECCYTAAQSLSMLGRPDEALEYLQKVSQPSDTYDRMMHTLCLMKIAEAKGDAVLAMKYSNQFDLYADSLRNAPEVSTIFDAERELDNNSITTLRSSNIKWKKHISWMIAMTLCSLLFLSFMLYRNMAHRNRIKELKAEIESQAELLDQINNLNDGDGNYDTTNEELLRQQHDFINGFLLRYVNNLRELMIINDNGNPLEFKRKFEQLTVEFAQDNLFWDGLTKFVNTKTRGVFNKLVKDCPALSQNDTRTLALMFSGFGYVEIAAFLKLSSKTMATHRKRIAKKLGLQISLIEYVKQILTQNAIKK